ncbi:hypothetical protein Aperf_G00000123859 [Anoplocephala perfoliata]
MLAKLTSGLLLFDNPSAHAPPMTHRLIHLYLVFVNLALLFYPSDLCADWTMGSIPLITSFSDWRNACTLFAFIGLLVAALRCASPRTQSRQALTLSFGLALLALPFLPASNLFFYVGFVVAERERRILSLYVSVEGKPIKCKLWSNVGHALESQLKFDETLLYFQQAVRVQPDDMGARINVGRSLVQLNRLDEAEEAYYQALDFFPKPKKGVVYHTRVSPKDLTIFINLVNLLAKNDSRLDEADALLRRAISLREDNVDAYQNRGSIPVRQRRFQEAENIYRTALKYRYTSAALHYNLGVVLLETNRTEEAYKKLTARNYEPIRVNFALAILYTDFGEFEKAARRYRAVLESHPDHIKSYMLLGDIQLAVVKNATFAIKLFEEAVKLTPNNLQARHNYCVTFIEGTADLEKGEECLQGATSLADPDNPNDEFVFRHLALIRAKRRTKT